jgi:type 1 glutamine amidotransferase
MIGDVQQWSRAKVVLAAMFAGAAAFGSAAAFADNGSGSPKEPIPGQSKKKRSVDPTYNVCRGTDPICYNDWGVQESKQNRVLIWSRTAGPRHAKLGTAHATGSGVNPVPFANNVAQVSLIALLAAEGIQADWTEDITRFSLGAYKAVIFLSSNRDTLWNSAATTSNDAARTTLRQFMREGNGFVAIHNAFGAEYQWPYYEGLLGNANFKDHGPNRPGTVEIIAHDSSTTGAGLPPGSRFEFRDEWYNLQPFPRDVKFLAKVDTSTLSPISGSGHPGHAGFHPVTWCQYYDGGKAWVTTLGHNAGSFTGTGAGAEGAAQFQRHLIEGIKSVMGLTPFCTGGGGGHDDDDD